MTRRRCFWIVAVALALTACKSATESRPTVTGSWVGIVTTQQLSMTLTESGGAVVGSGSLNSLTGGTNYAQTISGVFAPPTVSLTLTSGLHPTINLTATVSGNSMAGTLNGSGFANDGITLTRAP